MGFVIADVINQWETDEPRYNDLGKAVLLTLKNAIFEGEMYAEISHRPKDIISTIKKLKKKNEKEDYSYQNLTDLLGIRVICHYKEDIPKIHSIIDSLFKIKHFDDKSSNLAPDVFTYTSYHYDLVYEKLSDSNLNSLVFELQLRTINQHAWACTAHELSYKQDIELPHIYKRRVHRLLALYEIADDELSAVNNFIANHGDFSLFNCFKKLEKKFYRLAKIAFDKEESVVVLKKIIAFLSTSELNYFTQEFDKFIDENSSKIESIFAEYKEVNSYSYLILQPETIFVWFLLEKCEYKVKENWSSNFPLEELEVIENAWGIIE